ncbi:conserved hypothetical protein, partial [Ixodes scapularis]
AGVALMYMNLAERLGDPAYLKRALPLVETQLKGLKERRFSFLCGDAGPLAVGAVLYHLLGREEDSQKLVRNKHVVPLETDIPDELLYGRVGYLSALLFVRKHIATAINPRRCVATPPLSVVDSPVLLKASSAFPIWHPLVLHRWYARCWSPVSGCRHGQKRAFLSCTSGTTQLSEAELKDLVRPSVDAFVSLQYPSGNFPSSLGSETDKLVHWCHGAPGAAHLLALARTVFDDARYLEPLRKSVDVIWRRGLLKKGYGICHGVAGNAYAFLRMYQLTRELKYLHRAAKLDRLCLQFKNLFISAILFFFFFAGMAGTIYYMADLLEPGKAAFPAFQLC